MEGSARSGGVLKKKSSSGCLIIKKKVENGNSGVGGLSSNSKEKNRPRLVASDSGASDGNESLEFMRRKVNDKRLNGSIGCNDSENRDYRTNNIGININGERKRRRLYCYEYDEYAELDGERMRNEYVEDRSRIAGRSASENSNLKDFGVGSPKRNLVVDESKQSSYFDGSSSGRRRSDVGENVCLWNKESDFWEDKSQMPISLSRLNYQRTADESIRLQGKNGVLKVMVNKKKRMDLHSDHNKYDSREAEERGGSTAEDFVKKNVSLPLPVYPSPKPSESRCLLVDNEKIGVKMERKVKPVLGEGVKAREPEPSTVSRVIKDRELERDVTDTALKLAPPGPQACSSKKGVKKEEERTSSENVTPFKGKKGKGKDVKEGKAKRGGSTEKQMLREKIRGMLLDSGWTIDYRPRRNRDYLDAVYINPNGTAYWSIVKAYDELKKQLEVDNIKTIKDVVSPSFAPLSEDLINKLTRQTKKKIEEEMKRKRKEDGMIMKAKRSNVRDSGESSESDQNEEKLGSYMKQSIRSQKGKWVEVDQESDDADISDDSPKRKPSKFRAVKASSASKSSVLQGRTSKVIGRCTLLVRSSDKGGNCESDGYVPYSGKRTVLAWLIDSGTAHLSEKVQYMNRRRNRVMLEGWITRDGIHCGCCSKILTVSKFELHAGSKLRQPFQNIFLESGVSLQQCQVDAWNKQGESVRRDFYTVDVDGDDPDDDTCGICSDGGALICCDSCPSTFHQTCLEIQMLPSGDWHCPNCMCKFCGDACGNIAEDNDSASDGLTRCGFCEKKYHKSCGERSHALPMSPSGVSFCGLKCEELYDYLQKILGVKHELDAGFSWSLIQRAVVSDSLHRGFPQRVECNSKLAVALSVMDECFLPIIDRRSGINIIHNVVYNCGSNFNRLNYCRFYTAILERGDEIVSAASIRIHGACLAEMPFVGTREIYRRQGMCRRLLSAIETELRSLKVEKLIIPAITEHRNTWTTVFGFHPLEDELKKEIKSINMLVFPGTDMLQKPLVNQEFSGGVDSSVEHNKKTTNDSKVCHDKVCASDSICESDTLLASKETIIAKSESGFENQQKEPARFSTSHDGEESTLKRNAERDREAVQLQNDLIAPSAVQEETVHPAENDQPDLEIVVDGKVASRIYEALARKTAKNHTEFTNSADRNSW